MSASAKTPLDRRRPSVFDIPRLLLGQRATQLELLLPGIRQRASRRVCGDCFGKFDDIEVGQHDDDRVYIKATCHGETQTEEFSLRAVFMLDAYGLVFDAVDRLFPGTKWDLLNSMEIIL